MAGANIGWALAVAGYRSQATYRGAQLAAAGTDAVFGLLRSSVLLAALAGAGTIGGYDRRTTLAFVFIGQALLGPVHVFPWNELTDRIRSGDVAVDLGRPASVQVQYAFADAGRAAATVLPSVIPPLAVGTLVFGFFLPREPWPYLLGLPAAALAVAVSFGCRFLVSLGAFWIIEIRGVQRLYTLISFILCGLLVPVTWFPEPLQRLAWCTPFPCFLQIPADVLSGRSTGWTAVGLLALQAAWGAGLAWAGWAGLRAATRRLVVQGG